MKAKEETYCFLCNGLIYEGNKIVFDTLFQQWVHPECQVAGNE